MFRYAVVRKPGADLAQGLTSQGAVAIDRARAARQHAAYVEALRAAGLSCVVLDPLAHHPDACFVEDAALVLPELAVITRPGAPSRRGETDSIADALARFKPLHRLEDPATLDGGDVMVSERTVYVGRSNRTNQAGVTALRSTLAPHGYDVIEAPVPAGLHLKSSVNLIAPGLLLATRAFAALPCFHAFEAIIVADEEAYAANTLWVNDRLLVPAGFPRTLHALQERGFACVPLDLSEYAKLDGGLSCLSLRF